jgi:hypothetical protein
MSGNGVGYTFNISGNKESGKGTKHEENDMAGEYFERQHYGNFDNSSSFKSPAKEAELQKKRLEDELKVNEKEMERMLNEALKNKDLIFDSEEYDRLVQENIYLRNQLHEEPKTEYFYPPSFFKRLYKRCFGGQCEKVKVPYKPKLPSYYDKGKQRKTNTRKSNTRKSNTRKSNTRKRSNF